MSIKEKIEDNPVVWLLTTLVAGFLAGVGAYKAVIEMAGLTVVPQSQDSELRSEIDRLKSENQNLKQSEAALTEPLSANRPPEISEEGFLSSGERVKGIIVRLIGDAFEGSGVVVGAAEGTVTIVTVKHAIFRRGKLNENVRVQFYENRRKTFSVRGIHASQSADLAAFLIDLQSEPDLYVSITESLRATQVGNIAELRFGMSLGIIGHAAVGSWLLSVPGRYVFVHDTGEQLRNLQIDGFCPPGHQGAGVFNGQWELVSIIADNQEPYCHAHGIPGIRSTISEWGLTADLLGAFAVDPEQHTRVAVQENPGLRQDRCELWLRCRGNLIEERKRRDLAAPHDLRIVRAAASSSISDRPRRPSPGTPPARDRRKQAGAGA